jgi:nitrogenase molybdenum-iron protein alpha chain
LFDWKTGEQRNISLLPGFFYAGERERIMSIFAETPEIEVRERRLHSIIAYDGTGKDLRDKENAAYHSKDAGDKPAIFTSADRSFSQCAACPEGTASTITARTRGTAVVYHSPIGCSAIVVQYAIGVRGVTLARKEKSFDIQCLSSNITEQDTIFGAAEKLRNTLREAERRFHPDFIYIATSCASGIIGEDIESVAEELEEELRVPIVPVYCEGFMSKIWSSGFDAGYHGLLRKIVKPPKKRQTDLINIFGFEGTDTFSPLLNRMGLRTNYLVSSADRERLETISEAACSVTICETLSLYVASVLEEKYGVPEIKAPPPFGIDWTAMWLRAIGKVTGREREAEKVLAEDSEKYRDEIEDLRGKLTGKRIFISAGDAYGHNLLNVGKSLGLVMGGINSLHHDLITDNPDSVNSMEALVHTNGDIPNYSICNLQPYQMMKFIERAKPDVMINRHPGQNALGAKMGVPSIFNGDANYPIGYQGVVRFGKQVWEAILTKKFVETIARHMELPYSDWWLQQEDPFYFSVPEGASK